MRTKTRTARKTIATAWMDYALSQKAKISSGEQVDVEVLRDTVKKFIEPAKIICDAVGIEMPLDPSYNLKDIRGVLREVISEQLHSQSSSLPAKSQNKNPGKDEGKFKPLHRGRPKGSKNRATAKDYTLV